MNRPPANPPKLSRRVLFAGAGTAGAVAAVASVLPAATLPQPAAPEAPRQPPERGGGYVLSEHVRHYYKTARL